VTTTETVDNGAGRVPNRTLTPLAFSLLSAGIGVVAGVGAAVFRALIALFHNLLFLGTWSLRYDANVHTPPSPWGAWVVLVPVIGAAGVVFLVKTWAPEAKGHGVPEVMDAIYYNRGRIRPVVALIKSLASALSIGSGGSIGREGPIIQIGSSFGSAVGQWMRLPAWQRIALIAGGAGAGIAATFNTPVGGVLFVLEIMMHEVSARTLVPVAISTATATYVGRLFFGPHPSFVIPALETPSFQVTAPLLLLAYVGLGVIMGGVSALFIKAIYGAEDFFVRRVRGGYWGQHLAGMLGVGLLMYGLMTAYGHYYVEGVGYATVQDLLSGTVLPVSFLALLLGSKLIATSLTLGSGASGGIFSPALFLGATAGAAYGAVLADLFPGAGIHPPAFALAGMAGAVGGSTGAAMAAIVMIFEMTLDYNVIVPMTVTVAIAYGVRKVLSPGSIYTVKLQRRGRYIPDVLRTNPQFVRRAREMMTTDFGPVAGTLPLADLVATFAGDGAPRVMLVRDGERIAGIVAVEDALRAWHRGAPDRTAADLADPGWVAVGCQESLFDVMTKMRSRAARVAVVTDGSPAASIDRVEGIITRRRLADATVEASELYLD
jgi:chloride channel protein, CIC family